MRTVELESPNLISLSLCLYLSESERASLSTASTDRVFDFLELVLIESKFYTIFSVLFGNHLQIRHASV